jgi:hypothetical protein
VLLGSRAVAQIAASPAESVMSSAWRDLFSCAHHFLPPPLAPGSPRTNAAPAAEGSGDQVPVEITDGARQ